MTSSKKPQILTALTSVLGDAVLQPGSTEYEKDNSSYFSAFENEVKPSFIAKPNNVEQVQGLVRALRPYVLSGDCELAIRSGGHNPIPGSANVQGGVTIDMRGLKGIKLSDDQSVVEIAAGEIWTPVYAELEKYGLTVAGARVGHIGVAGFLLGGGLSIFSSQKGFACDSVVEFQVVLASGEVVRANAEENADLWRSLRGGMNNFGIVTSFKMKTFKSGPIWGGLICYHPDVFEELFGLIDCVCCFPQEGGYYGDHDKDTHLIYRISYGFGQKAMTSVVYHTRGEENPPQLRDFTGVESTLGLRYRWIDEMCTMRTSTQLDFCEELSNFSNDGLRQFWASITLAHKGETGILEDIYDEWDRTLEKLKDAEGFTFALEFHFVTKSMLENSAKAGGNAMAIPPSDGPLIIVLINPAWSLPEDDDRIFKGIENLMALYRQWAINDYSSSLLHPYIFANYAYKEDDVFAGYGQESVSMLRETSKKYDPEGLFQRGTPGGFKLPKESLGSDSGLFV
ncbi:FAD-binding domain-containing protein [Daldinia vernicosa]|uniref:FAD-binding domain-containing protein n=1 Tax=Daldinia vernicosa TaxID=114800 RepID=UPI0020088933|nr:FAD-binding domain-containing protein [Daldinia vernicosa]KAI0852941.1 FAD-binding domain-containing protein [Daldinia vernicosa]